MVTPCEILKWFYVFRHEKHMYTVSKCLTMHRGKHHFFQDEFHLHVDHFQLNYIFTIIRTRNHYVFPGGPLSNQYPYLVSESHPEKLCLFLHYLCMTLSNLFYTYLLLVHRVKAVFDFQKSPERWKIFCEPIKKSSKSVLGQISGSQK